MHLQNLFASRAGQLEQYMKSSNRLLNELVLSRMDERGAASCNHAEALMLYGTLIEAKPVLALVQNAVNIANGLSWHMYPFKLKHRYKDNSPVTSKAINSISTALESSELNELHRIWVEAFTPQALDIRNAIAHCAFHFPEDQAEGNWEFGKAERNANKDVVWVPIVLTRSGFDDLFKRLLGVRLGLFAAYTEQREKWDGQALSGEYENPKNPGEMLPYRFENNQLESRRGSVPFWEDQYNA